MGKKSITSISALLYSARNETELNLYLDLFLTPEEKTDLSSRYLIVRELLKDEKSQRQISQELKVSISKITRGSNELKRINPQFLQQLKKLLIV